MRAGLSRFARNRLALLGAFLLICLLLTVFLTPVVFPADPFSLAGRPLQPPDARFLLGTDTLGRNVAAEVAYGARTSLIIGGTVAGLVLTAIVLKKVGDSDVEDLGAEALEA